MHVHAPNKMLLPCQPWGAPNTHSKHLSQALVGETLQKATLPGPVPATILAQLQWMR